MLVPNHDVNSWNLETMCLNFTSPIETDIKIENYGGCVR